MLTSKVQRINLMKVNFDMNASCQFAW